MEEYKVLLHHSLQMWIVGFHAHVAVSTKWVTDERAEKELHLIFNGSFQAVMVCQVTNKYYLRAPKYTFVQCFPTDLGEPISGCWINN